MKTKIWIGDECWKKEYKRIFIVSDIHNHYQSYCDLRDRLGFSKGDLVIVDGDIVDRGGNHPDPLGICNEIRFPGNREYDALMIKGNHEQWLASAIVRYCENGIKKYHYNSLTLLAEKLSKEELLEYADWMLGLPLGIEMQVSGFTRKFKIAHASTANMYSIEESIMGSYDYYYECMKERKYTNIVGHTVTSIVRCYFTKSEDEREKENTDIFRVGDKLWCIDCGNGFRDDVDFPGKLGCLELADKGKVIEHYV